MKTVGITGGTGLVGTHLSKLLADKGFEVVIFTRQGSLKASPKGISYAHWDETRKECDLAALKRLDALIHLAGAGIADKRWTPGRKQEIVDSRVKGTAFIVSLLREHAPGCKTFVAASAIGFYGPTHIGHGPFSETDTPAHDFLAHTCRDWEAASNGASDFTRTVILRFGIVMGREGGAFPRFMKPLTFGLMPVLGTGTQVISWIEVTDLSRLILFSLQNPSVSGIYNAVAPEPVTEKAFAEAIASVKGGLKFTLHVPASLLTMLLGEMSIEILKSCAVSGEKITNAGFTFDHPDIKSAVKAILAGKAQA